MMKTLQDKEVQEILKANWNSDPSKLILSLTKRKDLPVKAMADQIAGRKKAADKLPSLAKNAAIIFPVSISMEQCSSEKTALFKSDLFSGQTAIDLTCGFGIDSFYISRSFERLISLEPNEELLEVVKHNFSVLERNNVVFYNTKAEDFLDNFNEPVDLIYLDPSRRSKGNSKVFFLHDCQPDVVKLLPVMFQLSKKVMIKTSPMLDIDQAIGELKHIERVIVLSVNDECKEVLYLLNKDYDSEALLEAVNLSKSGEVQRFSFYKSDEKASSAQLDDLGKYLYDPNAAVNKSGAFKLLSNRLAISKISVNTHLYTSNNLVTDFPGKSYEVVATFKYDKKEAQQHIPEAKAIVLLKNFPDTIEQVKKKLSINEGGDNYLICFRNKDQKPVLALARQI